MLTVISWNLAHCVDHWREIPNTGAQLGLLQEACPPPLDLALQIDAGSEPWQTGRSGRPWRACIAALDPRVRLERYEARALADVRDGEFAVSLPGTMAAANVVDPDSGDAFTLISMYGAWERPHRSTKSDWIYADASVHRLISDLSIFIGQQRTHRIIAAGDLNVLNGYGESGSPYWGARYQTVFDRMAALGLRFVGPQFPNGQKADRPPRELPQSSVNVPTFRTNKLKAETATRQLDFVFASESIADRVRTRACNDADRWGPSDHCMVRIEIG